MTDSPKFFGLLLGPVLALVILAWPDLGGFSPEARRVLAVGALMIVWWVTEAIPIYATALLPAILFPLLGVMDSGEATKSYGHSYVLMLLGAFILAKGIELQGLHKRLALLTIRALGTSERSILLGFMVATAGLSMWITNMAVVLIMLPIAGSIIETVSGPRQREFGVALLLGIAYAASVGGTGTLIGTPPNLVFAGLFSSLYPEAPEIGFLEWAKVGVPVVILLVPLIWVYLFRRCGLDVELPGGRAAIDTELRDMGRISKGELRILAVFVLTGLGWVFRKDLEVGSVLIPGWSGWLGVEELAHDSTVALLGAVLLFVIGDGRGGRLMNWDVAKTVPWGVAIFLGGGLALGSGIKATGLAVSVGERFAGLASFPPFWVVVSVVAGIIFLTEVNSNTATATIFLPILASVAVAGSLNPLFLMIPATFACSFAFMLPSGTGTNTVVFASERLRVADMARTGFWLNLFCVVILPVLLYFLVLPLMGIEAGLPLWAE